MMGSWRSGEGTQRELSSAGSGAGLMGISGGSGHPDEAIP